MAHVAGIDEAGYGPLLGPLVVGTAAMEVPDDRATDCLWTLLSASVSSTRSRRDSRLPILDSKKLYNAKHGLGPLERTALTAIGVWGKHPASWRDLLAALSPDTIGQLDVYPWYRDFDVDLPLANDVSAIRMQANAVTRDLSRHSARLADIRCDILPEGHFNQKVHVTRNKSTVLLGMALRAVDRVLRGADGQPVHVYADRHGGRKHYGQQLLTAMGPCEMQIVEESEQRSAYHLTGDRLDLRITFVTSGEQHHMLIALASIIGKYVRELFMLGLNRYWQQRVKDLRPTAGYYKDGQRFLADIAAAAREDGIDRNLLVRTR